MKDIIPLLIFSLQQAVKQVPGLAVEISSILSKDATPQDWADLRAKYLGKTYEDYVPESGLTPTVFPGQS